MGFLDSSACFLSLLHFDLIQSIICDSCTSFIVTYISFLLYVGDPGKGQERQRSSEANRLWRERDNIIIRKWSPFFGCSNPHPYTRSVASSSSSALVTMPDFRYPISISSSHFSAHLWSQWSDPTVIVPFVLSGIFTALFLLVEMSLAPEPVLAPFLLKQKIPVLVGLSNFLVAVCNFSVTYFFPMWFQTVMLTSASTAGKYRLHTSVLLKSTHNGCS
jgi:hypothetical protein